MTQQDREREIFSPLFYSLNSCNSQSHARLKPGAQNSTQVPYMGTRDHLGRELDREQSGQSLNQNSDNGVLTLQVVI